MLNCHLPELSVYGGTTNLPVGHLELSSMGSDTGRVVTPGLGPSAGLGVASSKPQLSTKATAFSIAAILGSSPAETVSDLQLEVDDDDKTSISPLREYCL